MRRLFVLSALAVSVLIIVAPSAPASATAMFMGLGERTNPYDVSGDGSTVVGWVDAHFADRERLFRSIVIGRFGDRERSGATPVSLFL